MSFHKLFYHFKCLGLFIIPMILLIMFQPVLAFVPDDLDFVPIEDETEWPDTSPAIVVKTISYKMVYIKPGTFMMGSPVDEPGRDSEEKQHRVTLTKGFYRGATEVTQGQWKKVMGSSPSYFKNCGDDCPVECVSWNDVQEFIRKLNRREGGNKYRLPTEAEWEYAARAGTTTPFYTGECLSTKQANYNGNYPQIGCPKGEDRSKTIEAASFPANQWGLYDMHGNVWERCYDWYGDYPSGHVTDPEGPSGGSGRVDRGGGWYDDARFCRSAFRNFDTPGFRSYGLGFRLMRNRYILERAEPGCLRD